MAVTGISGGSGLLISGTQSATSQYVQTGGWSKTDWLSVGKEALIGGTEGFVTGYIGAGAGSVLTNALGKTATIAPLLNSTSTVTRVASHAVIRSISQIGAGVTTRFAGSMITNGLDVEKSTKAAFNLQGILMDGAIGGVFGGIQGVKQPQASPQVQKVKGVGESGSVDNKSGVKSIASVTQSGVGGVKESGKYSPKRLIGHDFEDYLTKNIGGNGSFSVEGRDFDGGIDNCWWEAKSGNYWNLIENNARELEKFKSGMGHRLKIANDNSATYELFSNTPIPDSIKSWLEKKGIKYTELLD